MDFSRSGMGNGQDLTGSGQEEAASCCECGNETLGNIKCREFSD